MEDEDAISTLLARRKCPSTSPEREKALFAALPIEKQRIVVQRLPVIDAYIEARSGGKGDPERAARDLSLSVRSLYRLVDRVERMGAVAAIAPTSGAGRKPRAGGDKMPPADFDDVMLAHLVRDPTQSTTELAARMRLSYPQVSDATVRRHERLQRKKLGAAQRGAFGEDWLLDQVAVRIPVAANQGARWLVATFLVDVQTAVIAGWAPAKNGSDPALKALVDAASAAPMLFPARLKIADAVSRVTWILPDNMLEQGDAIKDRGSSLEEPVKVTVSGTAKFRRGSKLFQVLGGTIGTTDLLIRATANPAISLHDGARPLSMEAAVQLLESNVLIHNSELLGSGIRTSGPPSSFQGPAWEKIMGQLLELFEPVLERGMLADARARLRLFSAHSQS